mgnify:CR=1 FL=1
MGFSDASQGTLLMFFPDMLLYAWKKGCVTKKKNK